MSDTTDKLTEVIVELAQQPKSVTVDGQTTTMQSIQDVLAAQKAIAANEAAKTTGTPGGIIFSKIRHVRSF